MKTIQLDETHTDLNTAINSLHVSEKPTPKPGPGQVLVKIEAAPCNPSDLLFLQGKYGVQKPFPTAPGWEGAGRVVASGGGLFSWFLKDKRVACGGQTKGDGTWSEYFVANAQNCIPVSDDVPIEQAATLIINPMTAVGMVEAAVNGGHCAIIQTAACSQVAKMVQVLARQKKMPVINIVRRSTQVEELKSFGEKWVLNSEDPDFDNQLHRLAKELKATIAFEAVGGKITGTIFNAMPPRSLMLVYGALSEMACTDITPLGLIFEQKELHGFWLSKWLETKGFLGTIQATRLVQSLIKTGAFETKIRGCYGFDQWKSALQDYSREMTLGKVILKPGI